MNASHPPRTGSPGQDQDPGTRAPRILVFDSGLGGLTVFREIVKKRPDADYTYLADDACFPYGDMEEGALIERAVHVIGDGIRDCKPDLIVIACNTASTLVLPALREGFSVPFVGTVPAIKPACARSTSRLVSVLGTDSTVMREYTQTLIRDFAQDCELTLVGSDRLATMAEAALNQEAIDEQQLEAEISACFVQDHGRRTDVVVLACTHYPLLLDRLERLAPWPVEWLDPAEAIARRVVDLIGPADPAATAGVTHLVFTSGRATLGPLAQALPSFGILVPEA
jgi:glutamate racemase